MPSRLSLHVAASAKPRIAAAQKSCANAFDGRGRGVVALRRAQLPDVGLWRADFPDRWARLLRVRFGSVAAMAQYFDVTEQAVRYWLAGSSRPHGDLVALASAMWPEDYRRIVIEGGR